MKQAFRILLVLAVLIGVGWWFWRRSAAETARADAAIEASGTIEAVELAVAAEIGGRVLEVPAEAGDEVAEGDVLLRLDPALLEAQGRQTAAAVDLARAALAAAGGPGTPAGRLAAAQLAQAQAGADLLAAQLERLTLRAPADGVILERAVEPGEVAMPGAPLLTLGRLDELTITVYVPEDRYGRIAVGDKATVTADAFPDRSFKAEVTRIADRAEFTPRNVQTASGRKATVYGVTLAIEGKGGRLKPGMPADLVFDGSQR